MLFRALYPIVGTLEVMEVASTIMVILYQKSRLYQLLEMSGTNVMRQVTV
jgi:hypothetical protein